MLHKIKKYIIHSFHQFNFFVFIGVVEYLTTGKISTNHEDFKEFGYENVLKKMSSNEKRDVFSHDFRLSQGYVNDIIPYTNYTYVSRQSHKINKAKFKHVQL